jgi:hypothetical protein
MNCAVCTSPGKPPTRARGLGCLRAKNPLQTPAYKGTQTMMNDQIELAAEIIESYFEHDCVRVLCSPPAGLSLPEQARWAIGVFPLPVCKVEPISENGHMMLAVHLGATKTDTGEPPRTFRLAPPVVSHSRGKPSPIVSISLNGEPYVPPPPPPAKPPAPTDTCSRPVRVRRATHQKIRTLAKHLGLGVADAIDKAVSAYLKESMMSGKHEIRTADVV